MSYKKDIGSSIKPNFDFKYLTVRVFFNRRGSQSKLSGQYFILFAQSITHQWLLGVTGQNQIKNEEIFVQEEIKVLSVTNRVKVIFFCPLAKNS